MRRPFVNILILSIVLTVLYFWMEDRPEYITYQEDIGNVLFYGVVYTVLLFCTMSAIYVYFRKQGNSRGKNQY
jgi:hypothetical protein